MKEVSARSQSLSFSFEQTLWERDPRVDLSATRGQCRQFLLPATALI